jgi:universal stress protein E
MPDAPSSILATTDFSPSSSAAVRVAATLAARLGAELHAVHVVAPSAIPEWAGDRAEQEESERAEQARGRLPDHLSEAAPDARFSSAEVVVERPFRGIARRATVVGADLVVVGHYRNRPAGDAILGTTADRLLRTLEVPCLVVSGSRPTDLTAPAVAIDLSGPARHALDLALRWTAAGAFAPDGGAGPHRLDLLHIAPPQDAPVRGGWRPEEDVRDDVRREAQDAFERTGIDEEVDLRMRIEHAGNAVDGLLAAGAGVLVMGTHGHGFVQRALVGSVSSAVVRRTERAVLLVPPRRQRGGS